LAVRELTGVVIAVIDDDPERLVLRAGVVSPFG